VTVTLIEIEKFYIPSFFMGPESLFDKIGELFSKTYIDFKEFLRFSKNYLLKGSDETIIRSLFNS
jgi:hypothetical protein